MVRISNLYTNFALSHVKGEIVKVIRGLNLYGRFIFHTLGREYSVKN